ncbi:MAG: hypothetical protein II714_05265, partial [Oscillospiraceae bacterium]|nr:hypothetical protein [Oscillospiraceae bacterium]
VAACCDAVRGIGISEYEIVLVGFNTIATSTISRLPAVGYHRATTNVTTIYRYAMYYKNKHVANLTYKNVAAAEFDQYEVELQIAFNKNKYVMG